MVRRILDLDGDEWWLGQAPGGADPGRAAWDELDRVIEWLPAAVPGNVRNDLVRAGRLPDLNFGLQAETSQWVEDRCWWLRRRFSLPTSPTGRVHLVLRGVDYLSDLFVNGHHLGRHEGMFSPQVHDITGLAGAENWLAVRIVGSNWLPGDRSSRGERLLNQIEAKVVSIATRYPQRRDTLKCQMSFGWDFAPALRTMGIWDDVYAVLSGDVFIREVVARPQLVGSEAWLSIEVELDARTDHSLYLRCTLTGETFDAEPVLVVAPVELAAGTRRQALEFTVPQPRLWWPWDHGRPDLYRLAVEVWDGDQLLDSRSETVGLRRLELDGWTLRLNGQRIYARGANWVPADVLPGRVTEGDYYALLSLARQAHMNLLRVWGGGLREKRAFYDLCDRLGLLVWQEFPLACAFLSRFPRSPGYLHLVEDEARAIVRDLRNHPSLAVWCGGNEFRPERNLPVVTRLQRAVTEEDPGRPFLPASPANGDSHNWKVWHNLQPPAIYRDDGAAFASEFGLQAPPDPTTLRRFLPEEDLWPPGYSWVYHGAELGKLWRYARPFLKGRKADLEGFIRASQQAQAHGLHIAIEHYRRRKAQGCGGVLVWQLNEPWPAISWALVDFFRQPKPAYEMVRRLFAPLLISLDYPLKHYQAGDEFDVDVWVIHDRSEALSGCQAEVVLWDESEQPTNHSSQAVDVAADSAEVVGHLRWTLPPSDGWRLTARLVREGQTLAANEYNLHPHDDTRPGLRQRLWTWLRGLVMPS